MLAEAAARACLWILWGAQAPLEREEAGRAEVQAALVEAAAGIQPGAAAGIQLVVVAAAGIQPGAAAGIQLVVVAATQLAAVGIQLVVGAATQLVAAGTLLVAVGIQLAAAGALLVAAGTAGRLGCHPGSRPFHLVSCTAASPRG